MQHTYTLAKYLRYAKVYNKKFPLAGACLFRNYCRWYQLQFPLFIIFENLPVTLRSRFACYCSFPTVHMSSRVRESSFQQKKRKAENREPHYKQ